MARACCIKRLHLWYIYVYCILNSSSRVCKSKMFKFLVWRSKKNISECLKVILKRSERTKISLNRALKGSWSHAGPFFNDLKHLDLTWTRGEDVNRSDCTGLTGFRVGPSSWGHVLNWILWSSLEPPHWCFLSVCVTVLPGRTPHRHTQQPTSPWQHTRAISRPLFFTVTWPESLVWLDGGESTVSVDYLGCEWSVRSVRDVVW